MAPGWRYTKLSPSSALLLSFSGMHDVLCVTVPFFLSFFCFGFVFMLSLEL